MAKISFDFDSTLTVDVVYDLAEKLIGEGHEVWLVTSRFEKTDSSGNIVNNDDLFDLAWELGIPKERIHFCNMKDKYVFLENKGFLWHLDDDEVELSLLRENTDVLPIWRKSGNDWLNQCLDSIRIFSKTKI